MRLGVVRWDSDKFISKSLKFEYVFTTWVPKKNDLFLKDYKGQLWIFVYYIFIIVMDCCTPIDKMMYCWINTVGYYVNVILSPLN